MVLLFCAVLTLPGHNQLDHLFHTGVAIMLTLMDNQLIHSGKVEMLVSDLSGPVDTQITIADVQPR